MSMESHDDAPATKGDLALLVSRYDLALAIDKTNHRLETLHELAMTKIDQGFSKMTALIDGFMAQTLKVDRRQIIMDYRMDKIEKRVKTLES